ncbi:uncharacterized protein [Drosophila kikkawai]|uniref:Uncharacterized protein n=1 Tax=Drosophila kikkawai TaxID=30033 RepID=A0ABM4GMV3_DROKI
MIARDSRVAKSPQQVHGARQSHDVNGDGMMTIMMLTMTMMVTTVRHRTLSNAMTSVEAVNNADATAPSTELRALSCETDGWRGVSYPWSTQGRGVITQRRDQAPPSLSPTSYALYV